MERDVTILLLRIGLLATIYIFLFQVLAMLWRDLRPPAARSESRQAAFGLDVLDAAATGKLPGETLPISAITGLGRSTQNAIVLADQSVSGEHALVSFRLGQWWIEDLGSTNGTFINDAPVEQPTVIHTGDILRLGSVRLRVRL